MRYLARTITGLSILALVILLNYYGAAIWAVAILLVSILAYKEFNILCHNMGVYPLTNWIYFFNCLFILLPLLVVDNYDPAYVYVYQLGLIISAYAIIFPRILLKSTYTRFEDLTTSFWAVFQLGLLPSFFTWIRMMDNGLLYTLAIVVSIAANDTGSLLFGKLFGKKKLAPQISPGKTVAGSIGGLLCGTSAFLASFNLFGFSLTEFFWLNKIEFFRWMLPNFDLQVFTVIVVLLIGLLLAIVAQIGDLLVSALKRAAGVKDSGTLLQSHGGILDRVDSHFFAVWFAFFIFAYLLR
jgi:phosphatidate cytidylyltransferase